MILSYTVSKLVHFLRHSVAIQLSHLPKKPLNFIYTFKYQMLPAKCRPHFSWPTLYISEMGYPSHFHEIDRSFAEIWKRIMREE